MEDCELLELAAKAAGYELYDHTVSGDGLWLYGDGKSKAEDGRSIFFWNPLNDIDQAKQLRHKLCFSTGYDSRLFGPCAYATYSTGKDSCNSMMVQISESTGKLSALRRAIVQAAAEVGKAMP